MQDDNHSAVHEQQSWVPTSCKLAFVATFSKIKCTNFAFKKSGIKLLLVSRGNIKKRNNAIVTENRERS